MTDDLQRAETQTLSPQAREEFEGLLEYLKHSRGLDFSGYKRSTLVRRVTSRMNMLGLEAFDQYLDFLQVDPDEFTQLFDTLLVNVTGFFRDPPAWEYLAGTVIPLLVEEKEPAEPIRIWSAGCASGEEAYTLAMILAEYLGPEEMRDRVKIYGTDVDEAALDVARHASYGARAVAGVPEELLNRYFERTGAQEYRFRKDLRGALVFGRHDLVHAAPISHIDLLACRNTLMYFNAETQAEVVARFHFALEDSGILFLGKAEKLLAHAHLFRPADPKTRIFSKVPKDTPPDRLSLISDGGSDDALPELVCDAIPAAVVVVHALGTLAMANSAARTLFGLSVGDIGHPFQDLELSHRPAPLRAAVEEVSTSGRSTVLEQVQWAGGTTADCFDIHLSPVSDQSDGYAGVAITFVDVSLSRQLQEEIEHANRDRETTNQELQSAIEALETTNEELQSTNGELETMNAELQSTNEELQTVNDELRLRTKELDELNDFLESILVSQRGGMAVIDRDLRVTVWNHRSTELWGVRAEEAPGQHFLNLDIGLPVDDLQPAIKAVLSGTTDHQVVELDATNRRGRDFLCRTSLAPLLSKDRSVRGVILLMEEVEH
jgi:two-component system, chemotaxis family, CheB/CheR fusion protein